MDNLGVYGIINAFKGIAKPSFALHLAYRDVTLAVELGREVGVPGRLANLAREELTEALNRGWCERDSRVAMLLEEERAGVASRCRASRSRTCVTAARRRYCSAAAAAAK